MKAFLDTNIILDLLLEREGCEDCAQILDMAEDGHLNLYISALTMVNVAYVYRKAVGKNAVIPNLKILNSVFNVIPTTPDDIDDALYLQGNDYEDVVQAISASKAGCEIIITRNTKDFHIGKGLKTPPVFPTIKTPKEFLAGRIK